MAYYPISREELEAWMQVRGFEEEAPHKSERVFARYLSPTQRVIVYTTLLVGADAVRPTGGASGKRESMRVVAQYVGQDGKWYGAKTPDEKAKRKRGSSLVKRTTGWAKSLNKAVAKRSALVEPRGPVTDPEPRPAPAPSPPPPSSQTTTPENPELTGPAVAFPLNTADGPATIEFHLPGHPDELDALTDQQGVALALAMVPMLKGWQRPRGDKDSIAQMLSNWEQGLIEYGSLTDGQRRYLLNLVGGGLSKDWVFDRLVGERPEAAPEAPAAPPAPIEGCPDKIPHKGKLPKLSDEEVVFLALCIDAAKPEGWEDPYALYNSDKPASEFVTSFNQAVERGWKLSKNQRWRLHNILNTFRDAYVPPGTADDVEVGEEVQEAAPGDAEPMRTDASLMTALKEAKARLGWSGPQTKDFVAGLGITASPREWTVGDGRTMLLAMLEQLGDAGGGILVPIVEKPRVETQKEAVQVTAEAAEWAVGPLLTPFGATEEQALFIAHPGGPVLVDAIAGSGKTSTVIRRLLALWRSGQKMPRVLATTFTTAAAADMAHKWNLLAQEFGAPLFSKGKGNKGPDIRTIHSLGYLILRTMGRHFQVDQYDPAAKPTEEELRRARTPKQIEQAKRNAKRALEDVFYANAFKKAGMYDLAAQADVRSAISWYADTNPGTPDRPLDEEIIAAETAAYRGAPGELLSASKKHPGGIIVPPMALGTKVQDELAERGRVTFKGMQVMALELLDTDPRAASKIQSLYDHVIVDEAQDISPLELSLVFRVAGVQEGSLPNLALVGDSTGQSIYSFKGGRPELIQAFGQQAAVVPLTINFRSVGNIVSGAAALIGRSEVPVEGKPEGAPIEVAVFPDPGAEAEGVVHSIIEAHDSGVPWGDMAILYRVRRMSALVQLFLWRQDVPHYVEKGEIFWDSHVPRLVLDYFRFIMRPSDRLFRSLANTPFRKFPAGWPQMAGEVFGDLPADPSVWDVLDEERWPSKAYYAVESFREDLESVSMAMGDVGQAVTAVGEIRDSKGVPMMAAPPDRPSAGEDTKEWEAAWGMMLAAAAAFGGSVAEFVKMVDASIKQARDIKKLLKDAPPHLRDQKVREVFGPEGAVVLTTVHSSKGREWPHVFVIGFGAKLFPLSRSITERQQEGYEEERRLAYVAVTRAKESLLLSASGDPRKEDQSEEDILSPFAPVVLGQEGIEPPVPSPYLAAYAVWVAQGAPPGGAPFIIRPKEPPEDG